MASINLAHYVFPAIVVQRIFMVHRNNQPAEMKKAFQLMQLFQENKYGNGAETAIVTSYIYTCLPLPYNLTPNVR